MTDDVPVPHGELTGSVLGGRYEVLGKLGVGGMASVYEGRRVGLHNRVAIKVLKPELCEDPANVKRFLREARAASVIEHENIVDIVDFGSTEVMPVYFVMEFLEGVDVKQLIQAEGPVPWPRAHAILLQVVGALGAAHGKAIVHRDVKPANIFIVRRPNGQDWVKVLDFGIAKVIEEGGGITRGMTMTNGLLGTVAFMAPEQARGGTIDARTDIYALGVVMYQMLTGKVPFTGSNPFMLLERHVNEAPRPPRELNASIPPEAEAIILRCLAKKPDYRFASMAALAETLELMSTERLPGAVVQHITQTQLSQYAEPMAPIANESPTAHPSTDRIAPPAEMPARSGGNEPAPGGTLAVPATATPTGTAPPQATATMQVGGTSASGAQVSSTGQTQMLSHVMVPKRPKRRGPKAAFFGVGVGVGVAAAVGLTYLAMRPPPPSSAAEAEVPVAGTPAAAAVNDPPPQSPRPEPGSVLTDLKPLPATPQPASEQPNPELHDPYPDDDPYPEAAPAAVRPSPTPPKRPRRGGRKGTTRTAPRTAAAASGPDAPAPKPEKLHPDLKNPYAG